MPRYFFDVDDAGSFKDRDGIELPDLAAAREEAVKHFGEVLLDHAGDFTGCKEWQLTVSDHRGLTLLMFSFFMGESAAVKAMSSPTLRIAH